MGIVMDPTQPDSRNAPFHVGSAIVFRSIRDFAGRGRRVSFAVAGTVLHDDGDVFVVATTPGSALRTRAGVGAGPNSRIVPDEHWDGAFNQISWRGPTVVRVHRRGDSWSVWRWHDGSRWSDHWYGNLEKPWRRTPTGFDSCDWVLDVVVTDDPWTVAFKDADELAWMVDRGVVAPDVAETIHAVGGRLRNRAHTRAWPFDADWDAWTPPPGLPVVTRLPDAWQDLAD